MISTNPLGSDYFLFQAAGQDPTLLCLQQGRLWVGGVCVCVCVCVCARGIVGDRLTWFLFFPTSRLDLYEGIQFNSVNVYRAPTTFQAPIQKPGLK